MTTSGIVTLLTDFGTRDPFVGVMKGVVLGCCPGASLVDLTHDIEPGRVADGAFWLAQAYHWFPAGSVHLAVVDPGVGTDRTPLVVSAGEQLFVGPDNGLFEVVFRRAAKYEVRRIDGPRLGLAPASTTFHGRDVFAPVAGALAAGTLAFGQVGPEHSPVSTRLVPEACASSSGVQGEVIVVDRFGNLVTNLEGDALGAPGETRIDVAGRSLRLVGTYGDVARGECAAVRGSFGQLELFQRDGSAALALGAQRGTPVRVHRVA